MATPIIGYNNWFDSAVSVTPQVAAATGYEVENAYDWRSNTWWKLATPNAYQTVTLDMGSAMTPDCFGMAFHNVYSTLGANAVVAIRGSTDNFVSSNVLIQNVPIDSDDVIFVPVSGASYRYWRLVAYESGLGTYQALIGMLFLGNKYTMPHGLRIGWQNIYDNRQNKIINNIAQAGNFLGRSLIKQGVEGELKFEFMNTTEMRGNFRTFLEAVETKPFFFNWNPGVYDSDALVLWSKPNGMDSPKATHNLPYYQATLQVEGVIS